MWTGQSDPKPCSHVGTIENVEPASEGCADCIAAGDSYPDHRICMTCGYAGCCDGSKNKHMKKHVDSTGHQLVRPDDGSWMWCYEDEALLDPV